MIDRSFDTSTIATIFKNVRRVENRELLIFAVSDCNGNDTGMITYMGKNEWRVYVDNFPGEKKYFSWNLPITTLDEFLFDIKRTGLHLVKTEALTKVTLSDL